MKPRKFTFEPKSLDGLTHNQLRILIGLAVLPGSPDFKGPEHGSTCVRIAQMLKLVPITVYNNTKQLQKLGYVEIVKGNTDRIILKRLPDNVFIRRLNGTVASGANVRGSNPPRALCL